jgi:hypothetical protein
VFDSRLWSLANWSTGVSLPKAKAADVRDLFTNTSTSPCAYIHILAVSVSLENKYI